MNGKHIVMVLILLVLVGAMATLLLRPQPVTPRTPAPPVDNRKAEITRSPAPLPPTPVTQPAENPAKAPSPTLTPPPTPTPTPPPPTLAAEPVAAKDDPKRQDWIAAAYNRVMRWAPYGSDNQQEALAIIELSALSEPYEQASKRLNSTWFSEAEVQLIYAQLAELVAGEEAKVRADIEAVYSRVIASAPYGRENQREAYSIVTMSSRLPYQEGGQQLSIAQFSEAEVKAIYGQFPEYVAAKAQR